MRSLDKARYSYGFIVRAEPRALLPDNDVLIKGILESKDGV
jgi:hypothetical protein